MKGLAIALLGLPLAAQAEPQPAVAAQRAWIALRDGDCALEYAMWGSGSMGQIAGATCLLDKTAERTIYLRFLGRDVQ